MQLTRYTDYSLRVLFYLALRRDATVTITELATFYGISRDHLVKVVHALGKKGYVRTQRGKHGGMQLARPPADFTIGQVVRDMESNFAVVECFQSKSVCALLPSCGLKGVFVKATEQFLAVLDLYTLEDVLPPQPATFLRAPAKSAAATEPNP